ncbi:MAG: hypothetical protein Q8O89_00800 [Nanoarchaeota archaeon]|nr:hypothetical protein [Nanoarchaeota archaeon]
MQLKYTKSKIEFEKNLNSLDAFVIDFTKILNRLGIKYVIVSGYVAILFGRNRSSEDVDMIVEKIAFEKFKALWTELDKKFECIITSDVKEAYEEYLAQKHAIRFSRKGEYIPNMEIKFPKVELDFWAMGNKKEVLMNENKLYVSPIELQIPFKLHLGTEKDIEDARYLYAIFKEKMDTELLNQFNRKLNIIELFNKYLK